jgi:hypothetical protein
MSYELLAPKLSDSIALAEEVCMTAERLAAQATAWINATGHELTIREHVLTGLALKIESSFRALIDDARAGRAETMHHLKTMVESFIYFHVVAADTSDETARRLFAKTLDEKATFLRENDAAPERISALVELRNECLLGAAALPGVRTLATSYGPSLGAWYSAVYRLACEPAHVGDLEEFMPTTGGSIRVGPRITAEGRASVAIDRALELTINMIDTILQATTATLSADVDTLRAKLAAIRGDKPKTEETRA